MDLVSEARESVSSSATSCLGILGKLLHYLDRRCPQLHNVTGVLDVTKDCDSIDPGIFESLSIFFKRGSYKAYGL